MLLPVLIITMDTAHRDALAATTASCGLRPVGCGTIAAAKYFLARQRFTAILYEVPENEDLGAAVKQVACENHTPIVLVSRIENWDSYLSAIAAGAFDYVDFPPYPGELERILCLALRDAKSSDHAVAQGA